MCMRMMCAHTHTQARRQLCGDRLFSLLFSVGFGVELRASGLYSKHLHLLSPCASPTCSKECSVPQQLGFMSVPERYAGEKSEHFPISLPTGH